MRINTQLFILVGSGTLGGLGLAYFIGASYFDILKTEHELGENSVAIQQIYRLEEWSRQYLMTADMITGGGASYLLDGSIEQSKKLSAIISELELSSETNHEVQTVLQQIRECLRENQKLLVKFAMPPTSNGWTPAEQSVLTGKIDVISTPIEPAIDFLKEQFEESGRRVALQARRQRQQTIQMAIVVGACYLFVVMVGWSWFRHQIVTPLERLCGVTDASSRISQELSVETLSQSGPTEIRSLTSVIQNAFKDLREARDNAIDANKAKDLFLANISHELRTPMNSVIGMSELLTDTSLTSQQGEYLRILDGSASTLMQVISDLLDVSRIESNTLRLNSKPFRLREMLSDVIDVISIKAYEQGIKLTLAITEDVPESLSGDSLRLKQILLNLLSNAIKFSPAGEVGVTVACNGIKPASSQPDQHTDLLFTVFDTGIGIARDKRKVIFRPFEQVDGSRTRAHEGLGLGLAISRQLVNLMEGRIWVEENHPTGSRFRFTICIEVQKNSPVSTPPGMEKLKNQAVLIIDESDMNRDVLENLLSTWRMKPVCINDFNSGLSTLGQSAESGSQFDLVIWGLNNPTASVRAQIEQIRNVPSHVQVPIIVLTPSGRVFNDSQLSQGCAFIPKPIRHSQLMKTIIALEMQSPPNRPALPDDCHPATSLSLKILVAEDNIPNQKIISIVLTRAGHTVTLVDNGRQALTAFSSHSFDLLFMDFQMPEMDGLQATVEIRKMEKDTHIPIVGITGHAMEQHLDEARHAGMDRFVTKPFTASDLLAALE
jgi:signal transduction histidine kinase/DNA-binding response OmpR family regulator